MRNLRGKPIQITFADGKRHLAFKIGLWSKLLLWPHEVYLYVGRRDTYQIFSHGDSEEMAEPIRELFQKQNES